MVMRLHSRTLDIWQTDPFGLFDILTKGETLTDDVVGKKQEEYEYRI